MKAILGYFVCVNGAIWTVFDDGSSNHSHDLQVTSDGKTVELLGEFEGAPGPDVGRLIVDEYTLWSSLLELSAHIEAELAGATLEELRADLVHQLKIPDELDWSYLLETAARALVQADRTSRNMKFGEEAKIGYHNTTNDFGSHYSPLLAPTV
ncbi:hypothetical protein [Vibrio sp. R78045]|uniref:hypothetical protein n=1 Tax=Vibrio sp. R78045 TaxID=3093868 RepID=UPI0036F3B97C